MTPRQFLDGFRPDARLTSGAYYPQEPLAVEPGDRVGVVLMNLGGPEGAADVEAFLYNRLMDPAATHVPLPTRLRDGLCRLLARRRARQVAKEYEQIGGGSPLNRHARDQAKALERRLNERFGPVTGAEFKAYVAMRHWHPPSEETAARMAADGVTKVVLLPLHPHYSKIATGSSLAYWRALEGAGEIPSWPTTFVYEYAAHPKYVQALSERIDEGLQRFAREVRSRVPLVFVAHGAPAAGATRRRDPYCCLVHSTIQQVMQGRAARDAGRSFHVSFQPEGGLLRGRVPSAEATLQQLADDGHTAVLVVPVAFVSDHVETAFALDIEMRERAKALGIEHYEVTSGLNCHPLFVEALAECVVAQVVPADVARGDGAPEALPVPIPSLPPLKAGGRPVHCPECGRMMEARDWSGQPAVRVPLPEEVVVMPTRPASA